MDDKSLSILNPIKNINKFYEDLLGYSLDKTSLKLLNNSEWVKICNKLNANSTAFGFFLPRNQTAYINCGGNLQGLSIYHEYFGHGLFFERTLLGKQIIDLERRMVKKEKEYFGENIFSRKELNSFREKDENYFELTRLKKVNYLHFESSAMFTEYVLSKKFRFKENFERKYHNLSSNLKKSLDKIISFDNNFGNLATYWVSGFAKHYDKSKLKNFLENMYGEKKINNSKLVVLSGSQKSFSDIDLLASSNTLQNVKNNCLDLISFKEKEFEDRLKLFELQITSPLLTGKYISGDEEYFKRKKMQLFEQPITEEAINHNFKKSEEQRILSYQFPEDSKERSLGLSYSETYLLNALCLGDGERLLTKENLLAEKNNIFNKHKINFGCLK
ncbi:hypothetical protein HOD29_02060 [archaeon]|jgi:hypothetical protein|nr:hypothetical protein [archaeon]